LKKEFKYEYKNEIFFSPRKAEYFNYKSSERKKHILNYDIGNILIKSPKNSPLKKQPNNKKHVEKEKINSKRLLKNTKDENFDYYNSKSEISLYLNSNNLESPEKHLYNFGNNSNTFDSSEKLEKSMPNSSPNIPFSGKVVFDDCLSIPLNSEVIFDFLLLKLKEKNEGNKIIPNCPKENENLEKLLIEKEELIKKLTDNLNEIKNKFEKEIIHLKDEKEEINSELSKQLLEEKVFYLILFYYSILLISFRKPLKVY
jgi:hypothetical protein